MVPDTFFEARREVGIVMGWSMGWSVNRFGRSLQDLFGFMNDLHAAGVDLYLHKQGIDTTTPGGKGRIKIAREVGYGVSTVRRVIGAEEAGL